MKINRIILAFALAFVGVAASAQYVCTEKGTVLKYTETAEKETSTSISTITAVDQVDGVTTVTMTQSKPSGDGPFGEIVTNSTATFEGAGKPTKIVEMSADEFKSFIMNIVKVQLEAAGQYSTQVMEEAEKTAKAKGELSLELNPAAAEGDVIPASKLTLDMGPQRMILAYSNVVVAGFETVEVTAGKFENCMKVTYAMRATMPGNNEKIFSTGWYATGVGLVKEIKADKKGKTLETTELAEIVKP